MVSVLVIVALSLIAERVSPKVSGILAGYPLGAAITLFFLGFEATPQFAADSATYTLLGLISSQFFVFVYYVVSKRTHRCSVLISSVAAIIGFLVCSALLHSITLPETAILPVTCCATLLFIILFRKIDNHYITDKVSLSFTSIFIRAMGAATLILCVTSASSIIGEKWSGLFAAFPITLFPLILIIHLSYDRKHVHTIIKNFPSGLGSLIIYTVAVHYFYPIFGLFTGTLFSFFLATIYLVCFFFFTSRNPA